MAFSQRSCGIFAHVSSLPGNEGLGNIGESAFEFLEFLSRSKQSCWAILPLGPVNPRYNNNPYISLSSFAGDEDLLYIGLLYQQGLVTGQEYQEFQQALSSAGNWQAIKTLKRKILFSVGARFWHHAPPDLRSHFEAFCEANQDWLEDYAFFRAIKDFYHGQAWDDWPDDIANRDTGSLHSARKALDGPIASYKYLQFEFSRQWLSMRAFAKARGIKIFGDMPFFCGFDSADAWANPDLFVLRQSSHPASMVAAFPPSRNCLTGQIWDTCPMYAWNYHESQGFQWMVRRMEVLFERVDLVRLDHFQGYLGSWCVPLRASSARDCSWLPCPGDQLLEKWTGIFAYDKFVAEDIGFFPDTVIELRDRWKLAGMKVLHYAFDTDHTNPHLPHNFHTADIVVYTGTHDTDTSLGWHGDIPESQKQNLRKYIGSYCDKEVNWSLMQFGANSIANQFIIPLQDVLGLGSDSRMNIPDTEDAGWDWVCERGALNSQLANTLADLVIKTKRTAL